MLVGSDCIICRKYAYHSVKMSLQGWKKRIKGRGGIEMVYNMHKLMNTECEVSITIPLSKVQNRVAEETRVSRTLCKVE